MIKGVIFDVDGVILDSISIWQEAATHYLVSINVSPGENLNDILWNMSIPEGAAYLKEQYRLSFSEEVIAAGVLSTIRDFYYHTVQLKPGIKTLLESYANRQIPMVIATSGEKTYVEKAFARLGISHYFKDIVTPLEVGAGKTSPKIYLTAAAILGSLPEETLVFEDALHALQTSKQAGFRTVGVYDTYSAKNWEKICELADHHYVTK